MTLPNSRLVHPRFHENLRRSAVGTAGMPDHGTITRPGEGAGTVDPVTARWTPPAGTEVFTGDLRVQAEPSQQRGNVEVGDDTITLHRYRASIPYGADQVLVDDVLVLDRSTDEQLVGRPLIVRDVHYSSFAVNRYLLLEDHPELPTPEA